MAEVTPFNPAADRLAPPASLSDDERRRWLRLVEGLRAAGTAGVVLRLDLLRAFRADVTSVRMGREIAALGELTRQVGELAARLDGADRALLVRVEVRLHELSQRLFVRERRASRRIHRFLARHGMLPSGPRFPHGA